MYVRPVAFLLIKVDKDGLAEWGEERGECLLATGKGFSVPK